MRPTKSQVLSYFAVMALIFLVLGIGLLVTNCSYQSRTEVEYSSDIKSNYPVYVDITSIVPVYTMSSDNDVYGILCECKTTSGNTVWIQMDTDEYEIFDPSASISSRRWGESSFEEVFYPEGLRIHGRTKKADRFAEDTSEIIILFESTGE